MGNEKLKTAVKFATNKLVEDVRRSCLNCGGKHYNYDPCCSDPFCVSDLQKTKDNLEKDKKDSSDIIESIRYSPGFTEYTHTDKTCFNINVSREDFARLDKYFIKNILDEKNNGE